MYEEETRDCESCDQRLPIRYMIEIEDFPEPGEGAWVCEDCGERIARERGVAH